MSEAVQQWQHLGRWLRRYAPQVPSSDPSTSLAAYSLPGQLYQDLIHEMDRLGVERSGRHGGWWAGFYVDFEPLGQLEYSTNDGQVLAYRELTSYPWQWRWRKLYQKFEEVGLDLKGLNDIEGRPVSFVTAVDLDSRGAYEWVRNMIEAYADNTAETTESVTPAGPTRVDATILTGTFGPEPFAVTATVEEAVTYRFGAEGERQHTLAFSFQSDKALEGPTLEDMTTPFSPPFEIGEEEFGLMSAPTPPASEEGGSMVQKWQQVGRWMRRNLNHVKTEGADYPYGMLALFDGSAAQVAELLRLLERLGRTEQSRLNQFTLYDFPGIGVIEIWPEQGVAMVARLVQSFPWQWRWLAALNELQKAGHLPSDYLPDWHPKIGYDFREVYPQVITIYAEHIDAVRDTLNKWTEKKGKGRLTYPPWFTDNGIGEFYYWGNYAPDVNKAESRKYPVVFNIYDVRAQSHSRLAYRLFLELWPNVFSGNPRLDDFTSPFDPPFVVSGDEYGLMSTPSGAPTSPRSGARDEKYINRLVTPANTAVDALFDLFR